MDNDKNFKETPPANNTSTKNKKVINGLKSRKLNRVEYAFNFDDPTCTIDENIRKARTELAYIHHKIEKKLLYDSKRSYKDNKFFLLDWLGLMLNLIAFLHRNIVKKLRRCEPSFIKDKSFLNKQNMDMIANNCVYHKVDLDNKNIDGEGKKDESMLVEKGLYSRNSRKNMIKSTKKMTNKQDTIIDAGSNENTLSNQHNVIYGDNNAQKIFEGTQIPETSRNKNLSSARVDEQVKPQKEQIKLKIEFYVEEYFANLLTSILMIGRIWRFLGKHNRSKIFFKKTLELVECFDESSSISINKSVSKIYLYCGKVYTELGRNQLALSLLDKSIVHSLFEYSIRTSNDKMKSKLSKLELTQCTDDYDDGVNGNFTNIDKEVVLFQKCIKTLVIALVNMALVYDIDESDEKIQICMKFSYWLCEDIFSESSDIMNMLNSFFEHIKYKYRDRYHRLKEMENIIVYMAFKKNYISISKMWQEHNKQSYAIQNPIGKKDWLEEPLGVGQNMNQFNNYMNEIYCEKNQAKEHYFFPGRNKFIKHHNKNQDYDYVKAELAKVASEANLDLKNYTDQATNQNFNSKYTKKNSNKFTRSSLTQSNNDLQSKKFSIGVKNAGIKRLDKQGYSYKSQTFHNGTDENPKQGDSDVKRKSFQVNNVSNFKKHKPKTHVFVKKDCEMEEAPKKVQISEANTKNLISDSNSEHSASTRKNPKFENNAIFETDTIKEDYETNYETHRKDTQTDPNDNEYSNIEERYGNSFLFNESKVPTENQRKKISEQISKKESELDQEDDYNTMVTQESQKTPKNNLINRVSNTSNISEQTMNRNTGFSRFRNSASTKNFKEGRFASGKTSIKIKEKPTVSKDNICPNDLFGGKKLFDEMKKNENIYEDNHLTNKDFFYEFSDFNKFKVENKSNLKEKYGKFFEEKPQYSHRYTEDKFLAKEMPDEVYSYINQAKSDKIASDIHNTYPQEMEPYFYTTVSNNVNSNSTLRPYSELKFNHIFNEKLNSVITKDYEFFRKFFKMKHRNSQDPNDPKVWQDFCDNIMFIRNIDAIKAEMYGKKIEEENMIYNKDKPPQKQTTFSGLELPNQVEDSNSKSFVSYKPKQNNYFEDDIDMAPKYKSSFDNKEVIDNIEYLERVKKRKYHQYRILKKCPQVFKQATFTGARRKIFKVIDGLKNPSHVNNDTWDELPNLNLLRIAILVNHEPHEFCAAIRYAKKPEVSHSFTNLFKSISKVISQTESTSLQDYDKRGSLTSKHGEINFNIPMCKSQELRETLVKNINTKDTIKSIKQKSDMSTNIDFAKPRVKRSFSKYLYGRNYTLLQKERTRPMAEELKLVGKNIMEQIRKIESEMIKNGNREKTKSKKRIIEEINAEQTKNPSKKYMDKRIMSLIMPSEEEQKAQIKRIKDIEKIDKCGDMAKSTRNLNMMSMLEKRVKDFGHVIGLKIRMNQRDVGVNDILEREQFLNIPCIENIKYSAKKWGDYYYSEFQKRPEVYELSNKQIN